MLKAYVQGFLLATSLLRLVVAVVDYWKICNSESIEVKEKEFRKMHCCAMVCVIYYIAGTYSEIIP